MKLFFVVVILLLSLSAWARQEELSYLKDGDVWVCSGDSITHADTYRRTLQRVIGHFHPDADIRVLNSGKSGALIEGTAAEFEKAEKTERPTIVSIMSAMNHSINSGWRRAMPADSYFDSYIQGLDHLVKAAKAKGMSVIVMSPTLTDETVSYGSYWNLTGTRAFLETCTERTKRLAAENGVIYLPVSEEFEAAQTPLQPEQVLRPDGVHPSSVGEYRIASTFIHHLNLAGPLAGVRTLDPSPAPELPVAMSLQSRFLQPGERKIGFDLNSPEPMTVTATWSSGKARGTQTLKLSGKSSWTIELPAEAAKLEPGQADDVMIDLTDGARRSIYVVDLCSTRVMHLKDDKLSGSLKSKDARPEGKTVANWSFTRVGNGLLFEAEVFDSEIRNDFDWPWGNDNVTLWLDYRPTERFAGIGVDSDVHQVILGVSDKPEFSVSLIPWLGLGMARAASVSGEKTPTGYKVRMYIHNKFGMYQDSDLSKRDFVGFNISNFDLDTGADGKQQMTSTRLQETEYAPDQYANSMIILDLKGKIAGDRVTNVYLSRL